MANPLSERFWAKQLDQSTTILTRYFHQDLADDLMVLLTRRLLEAQYPDGVWCGVCQSFLRDPSYHPRWCPACQAHTPADKPAHRH